MTGSISSQLCDGGVLRLDVRMKTKFCEHAISNIIFCLHHLTTITVRDVYNR
jgi:hypothetical protein